MISEKKPLNVDIGRRVQISREQAGLTQEQLAERINRSTQFISTVERGLAGASLETIISLCEVLNVSSDWLLRGKADAPSVNSISAKLASLSSEQLVIMDHIIDNLLSLMHE